MAERADFQRILEIVDNATNTAVSDDTAVLTKLMVLSDAEQAVEAFADFYRGYIPATVVNNLAEDLKWVIDRARQTAATMWLEGQRK